ncbi:MAG: prolyl-tRNA synthetase associated domain-containing protein [Lachnospiraceae bacterium]|jgi:Ala-tRNA(Pro) deacylase|nr:prolyl-tRNA synthetase associated domain-containing protein [Lachnospiraceae bacterium]
MINVSEVMKTPPLTFKTPLHEKVYKTLEALKIPFERVDTDEAVTMEDCENINKRLDMDMVKTLFLCNRQQTMFYLFVTAGNKPFVTSEFSKKLGVSRISFAPVDLFEKMLGTKIGAATVFSALIDEDRDLQIVIDADVANSEWYGCSDGTNTGYMKVSTKKIIEEFLPYTKHKAKIIEL